MPSTQMQKSEPKRGLLQKQQDSPQLPALIENLEPPVLHKLIQQIGLGDSGDIIALATTDQLKEILEIELWQNQKPGAAETLDSDQFLSWLAVWNEIGSNFTATKLFELGDDFLVLCLAKVIMVAERFVSGFSEAEVDFDNLGITNTDLDPWEAINAGADLPDYSQDFGDFGVMGKDIDHWDTIVSSLNSLWQEQPDYLLHVLRRCCFERSILSEDTSENDSAKVLHQDMAQVRESKREKQGFVTPLNASIFLMHAKSGELEELCNQTEYDLNTQRQFKLAEETEPVENQQLLGHQGDQDVAESTEEDLLELKKLESVLVDADIISQSKAPLLLQPPRPASSSNTSSLQTALNTLAEENPEALSARLNELMYMSNILMTGAEFKGGRFLETEAAKAVMATCNLGMEYLVARQQTEEDDTDLYRKHLEKEPGLIQAFQVGFNLINRLPMRSASKTTEALTSNEADRVLSHSSMIRSDIDQVLADGGLTKKVEQGMLAEAKEIIDLLFMVFDPNDCNCLTALVDGFPCFPMTLDHPDKKPLKADASMRYIRSLNDLSAIDRFLNNLILSV